MRQYCSRMGWDVVSKSGGASALHTEEAETVENEIIIIIIIMTNTQFIIAWGEIKKEWIQ